MDANTLNEAFAFVQRTYRRAPCDGCRSLETWGTIYERVVIVMCDNCGWASRIGPLAAV